MACWLETMPVEEARRYLLQMLQGQSKQAERGLRRAYAQHLRLQAPAAEAQAARTVAELLALSEAARAERLAREEAERQREREERRRQRECYLATLATDFERHWRQAETLAGEGIASAYDRARNLLVDLADAYALQQRREEFQRKLNQFRLTYARRTALMRRLDEAGLISDAVPEGFEVYETPNGLVFVHASNSGTKRNWVTSTRPLSVSLRAGITGRARKERLMKGSCRVQPSSWVTASSASS